MFELHIESIWCRGTSVIADFLYQSSRERCKYISERGFSSFHCLFEKDFPEFSSRFLLFKFYFGSYKQIAILLLENFRINFLKTIFLWRVEKDEVMETEKFDLMLKNEFAESLK